MKKTNNFALIGMAGVGKSHIGKKLADILGYRYIEVDEIIGQKARAISTSEDLLSDQEFINVEEQSILELKNSQNSVIDTGGSVVYSDKAMALLKVISTVVYLEDSVVKIKQRYEARGEVYLVGLKGKTFEELFIERKDLYEKYADLKIDVSKQDIKQILAQITKQV